MKLPIPACFLFLIVGFIPLVAESQSLNKYCYSSFHTTGSNDSVLVAGGQVSSGFGVNPKYYTGYYPLQHTMMSIDETSWPGIQVFPNPFTDVVNVVFDTDPSQDATIQVINLQGQLMIERSALGDSAINAEWFSPGIYLLVLTENGVPVETHKLVKY